MFVIFFKDWYYFSYFEFIWENAIFSDLLVMVIISLLIKLEHHFSRTEDMLSMPALFLGFREFIAFLMSSSTIILNSKVVFTLMFVKYDL